MRKRLSLLWLTPVLLSVFFWPMQAQTVKFFYIARSVDAQGVVSAASNEAVATFTPGSKSITLNWTASVPGSDTAVGYFIYKGTAAGAESTTPLNGIPVTVTTFTDTVAVPNPPTGLQAATN